MNSTPPPNQPRRRAACPAWTARVVLPTPASPATAETTTGPDVLAGSSSPASTARSSSRPVNPVTSAGSCASDVGAGAGRVSPSRSRTSPSMPFSCWPCRWVTSSFSWDASGNSGPPRDPRTTISRSRRAVSFSASPAARHPQHVRGGPSGPGQAGIIQHRQLPGDPCLQRLQHRPMPGQRRARHRLAEHLADHHRQLVGLLVIAGAQLPAVSWTAAVAAERSARS